MIRLSYIYIVFADLQRIAMEMQLYGIFNKIYEINDLNP